MNKLLALVLCVFLASTLQPAWAKAKHDSQPPAIDTQVIESEIEATRALVAGYAESNRAVLKMYDKTAANWLSYYVEAQGNFNLSLLLKAVAFAAEKHAGQVRKDAVATPYIVHPLGVARILSKEAKVRSVNVLIAALLHDTLEDTDATAEEIEATFGARVLTTVQEVTNDPTLSGEENKQRQVDLAPQASLNAQLVKLADRLYNTRDLRVNPPNWDAAKVESAWNWAEKLLKALEGVNPSMEKALAEEVVQQRLNLVDSGSN